MAAPKSSLATGAPPAAPTSSSSRVPIGPFLIGTAVGGLVGAIAGTLLANATRRLLFRLVQLVGRRLSDADRDRLRFELLLQ